MMRPIPPEMSQVSVPTLVRCGAWAEAGNAMIAATAAAPMRDRIMGKNSTLRCSEKPQRGTTHGNRAGSAQDETVYRFKGLWLLQVAAEALDAAARLLQRRGRGRIRDAERRPEAE